jgi:hypothetical protein
MKGFYKMTNFVSKQPSSYPTKYQKLSYNAATAFSTNFGAGVNQIRVATQLAGWGTVNQSTADSIIASSAGGTGMIIPSGVEVYLTLRPGQLFTFSSTSTSSGDCTVTEMG